jgi:hypothetical protein
MKRKLITIVIVVLLALLTIASSCTGGDGTSTSAGDPPEYGITATYGKEQFDQWQTAIATP